MVFVLRMLKANAYRITIAPFGFVEPTETVHLNKSPDGTLTENVTTSPSVTSVNILKNIKL